MTELETAAAARGSATWRILQPTRHGGLGCLPHEFVEAICEAAAADVSAGWLAAIANAAAFDIAQQPDHIGDAVWGEDPEAIITTSSHGTGAIDENGRLVGRWDSIVAAAQADWLLLPVGGPGARRVLIPRGVAHVDVIDRASGLRPAGTGAVSVSNAVIDRGFVLAGASGDAIMLARAGVAAAVVGSADGLLRTHIDEVRARLAASRDGDEVTDESAAQVAWATSDIDAARVQVAASVQQPQAGERTAWAHQQAVARARDAADRLMAHSRHALNASDAVTQRWGDIHAGCRLAGALLAHSGAWAAQSSDPAG